MVGGGAEAVLVREFAADRLGGAAVGADYRAPPEPLRRVLLLDRDAGSPAQSGSYGRGLQNRAELEAIIAKYVPRADVTLLLDSQLYAMGFREQAALFASHAVLVMAHGAGMVNAAFLPPRSAVVELNSFNMWCPIYSRMLTGECLGKCLVLSLALS
jgi:hypothetical protein